MSDQTEERAHLESERDFLLKSLDDLEAERAAGNIDDESYQGLHDDYTARAAAAIRALRDGVDARPAAAPMPQRRRLLVGAGVVAFAVLGPVALAAALGARLPGQTASGNSPATANTTDAGATRLAELKAAVASNPSDVGSHLLLAPELERTGDLAGALKQYDAVIGLAPTNAQAYAQSGRVLYLVAGAGPADQAAALVDQSKARLDRAVELDPTYADARFFRAIVLANEFGDFAAAQGDLQRYLLAAPNGEFADQARQLLADVTVALEGTVPTTVDPSGKKN